VRFSYKSLLSIDHEVHPIFPDTLVGHSFGADACVEAAWKFGGIRRLFLIDPVPRNPFKRWLGGAIQIPDNVTDCICYRAESVYPLAKWCKGNNVKNIQGKGNHNTVIQDAIPQILAWLNN
jgi:pimeloyl-ACP methyl ester carboxylesterase